MTIADAFEGVIPPPAATKNHTAVLERPAAPADDPVPVAAVSTRLGVTTRLKTAGARVTADLTSAWLWDAHGPSPCSLWQTRIPALEQVPGENAALRGAWIAYNHAVLPVLVPLMFAFWVLCHPARLLYAAPIAAPLLALWLV